MVSLGLALSITADLYGEASRSPANYTRGE